MSNTPTPSGLKPAPKAVGLIGFGEAGQAFVEGWRRGIPDLYVTAFDLKTDDLDTAISAAKRQEYEAASITGCDTLSEGLGSVQAVFSLVTADQAHAAARDAAKVMPAGAMFFDCNSCAPDAKRASAKLITTAGLRYVDVAVMAPVHPKLHQTPLLICGPDADDARIALDALGMKAEIVTGDTGRASSIKMMRSVMIKGLEALTLECVLSARKAGVDAEVLASLDASFPGFDWPARASYMMERCTTHGIRRAAEMREVVKTVTHLGLSGDMAAATVNWQQAMGDLQLESGPDDYGIRADAILSALKLKGSL